MTRDHDLKRAVRARMTATGEKYTVARSALVAPATTRAGAAETSESQGGTVATINTDLLEEIDERGYAVLRSFVRPDGLARISGAVDEAVAAALAEKEAEDRKRRAAGESGFIDVWRSSEPGGLSADLTAHPGVSWVLGDERLVQLATELTGSTAVLHRAAAWVTLPGFGHQGLHPNGDGPARQIGSWPVVRCVVIVSPHRPDTGTFRAIPGSHRHAPTFDGIGSAMRPHRDEERIEADPGDVIVYSDQLWKSSTFNAGAEPLKSLLVD
jgi:ectoine hydroxylase-related dioxygenase (phytanoyl-CoA dioxygenase family)